MSNPTASPVLQCPACRTYTTRITRAGEKLLLDCAVCAAVVVWRPLFARRQELIIDHAALAEHRRDRR